MISDGEHTGILEFRVANLEGAVDEIRGAVKSIDSSLRVLTRLEERHQETRESLERAFKSLSDHETRLREIEKDQPTMKMTRNWVITGVIAMIGMVTISTTKIIADNHEYRIIARHTDGKTQ